MRCTAVFYSAKTWVGNCPPCPPISCAPATKAVTRRVYPFGLCATFLKGAWPFQFLRCQEFKRNHGFLKLITLRFFALTFLTFSAMVTVKIYRFNSNILTLLALVRSIPSWLVWTEIEYGVCCSAQTAHKPV